MRDIDTIIAALCSSQLDVAVEQLKVRHVGADDDGVWFFRSASCPFEVQLESSTGQCPFIFESGANTGTSTAHTVADAIAFVTSGLGLRAPSA